MLPAMADCSHHHHLVLLVLLVLLVPLPCQRVHPC
jgi:hypothetical protein